MGQPDGGCRGGFCGVGYHTANCGYQSFHFSESCFFLEDRTGSLPRMVGVDPGVAFLVHRAVTSSASPVRPPRFGLFAFSWMWVLLGLLLFSVDGSAESSGDLRTRARSWLEKGETLVRRGEFTRGCLRIELAYAAVPEWWYAGAMLAELCRHGDPEDALYLLNQAVSRRGPWAHQVDLALAGVALKQGRAALAMGRFQAILEEHGPLSAVLVGLADAARARGDQEASARWLKRMLYLDSAHVRVRWRLARIGEKLGDLAGAEEHLRHLATDGPDPRRGLVELRHFYHRHGRDVVARRVVELLTEHHGGIIVLPPVQFFPSGTP